LEVVATRLNYQGFKADLSLFDGRAIPHDNNSFDIVVAWQVLYYNDEISFNAAIQEIERVLKPGGTLIFTMPGSRDVSRLKSKLIKGSDYVSTVRGQEGAKLFMPDKNSLSQYWPRKELTFAEFEYSSGQTVSHHLIISHHK
jgi:SAM-dependent methyltransferase